MIFHFFNYRHSECERRLCFQSSPEAGNNRSDSWMDTAGKTIAEGPRVVSQYMTWMGVEGSQQVLRVAFGIPYGAAEGAMEAILGSPEDNSVKIESLENLADDQQWISAFKKVDIFTQQLIPLDNTKSFGPLQLLQSLTPTQRQEMYEKYVNSFIPVEVQRKHFQQPNKKPLPWTIVEMMNHVAEINNALEGMMGTVLHQNPQKEIAEESLRSYFAIPSSSKKVLLPNKALSDDYAEAMDGQSQSLATVPNDVQALENTLSPSRLKGALANKIIDNKLLQVLQVGLDSQRNELLRTHVMTKQGLSGLSESTNLTIQKESETLRDTWRKMGGMEKFILFGAAIGSLIYSSKVRVGAGILTGAYFFQKIFMKEQDPVKKWSQWIGMGVNPLKGVAGDSLGAQLIPGYVDKISTRSDITINFLDDFSRKELASQAIGMGVIFDQPLSLLAINFKDSSLDLDNDEMDTSIQTSLSKHGWSADAYQEYLSQPDHQEQIDDGMKFVFFRLAALKGSPDKKDAVKHILSLFHKLPADTSLSVFASQKRLTDAIRNLSDSDKKLFTTAVSDFNTIVLSGQNIALKTNQTLGDFKKINHEQKGRIQTHASTNTNTSQVPPLDPPYI